MRYAFVLFLALTLLAGCAQHGVDTGGTPGDDDDDDGATVTPTPTPTEETNTTTPPNSIGGYFSVNRVRRNDGTDEVQTAGFFNGDSMQSTGEGWNNFFSYFASTPVDTCVTINPSGSSPGLAGQDAGEGLTLTGPSGATALQKYPLGPMIMYAGYSAATAWEAGAPYTLSGLGGPDIGAFTAQLEAPGEAVLTSPNLFGSDPMPVSTSQAMDLTWTSVPDGRPVLVFLSQGAEYDPNTGAQTTPEKIKMCKFTDDGAATIPAAVMSHFIGGKPSTEDDVLQVQKYRWHTISPGGASGAVLIQTDSSTYIHVRWES